MKISNLIVASALAVAFVDTASAQTTLRVTGSTAFRGAVYRAIQYILAPVGSYSYAYSGSSLSSATVAVFVKGTGSSQIVIKTSFTGSLGGIAAVSHELTVGPNGPNGPYTGDRGWLLNWLATTTGTSIPVPVPHPDYDAASTADVTLSDAYQTSAAIGKDKNGNTIDYTTPVLTDNLVAVVPFVWVKTNTSSLTGVTSVGSTLAASQTNIKALFGKTLQAQNLPGGTPGDTTPIYAFGQGEDSGTRIAAFADNGLDPHTQVMGQMYPLFDNGGSFLPPPQPTLGTTLTGYVSWPALTLNNIVYGAGDSGFDYESSLAEVFTKAVSITPHYVNAAFLGYFGINDAKTASPPQTLWLQYAGKGYSLTALNGETVGYWDVTHGFYQFWANEHFMYRSAPLTNPLTGNVLVLATKLMNAIKNNTANASGVFLKDMTVHRSSDGGTIQSGGYNY